MEAMCLMVQMRREVAKYQEVQVLVAAIRSIMPVGEAVEGADMDGKIVRDILMDYRESLMPFIKKRVEREETKLVDALKQEASRGPLRVTPIANPTVHSRLQARAVEELAKPPIRPHWNRRRR